MNAELLYTSAPEGLKRGSRGFCTVVATEGLPINVSQRLESLSGYRHVFQPGEDRDAENPVCYSHLRFTVGGRPLHVVSRIAAYGVDYSQRTNKIAHHIVVDRPPQGGPVPILQSDAFLRSWDGTCRTKPQGPSLSGTAVASAICHRWESITGDAGWGGQLAAAWSASSSKPVWIVFELSQSQELLSLIGESIALLPEAARWDATFSTYYTNLPPDVECRVRCVLAGSEEARMAAARGTVIRLAKKQGEPPKSSWVEAARTGHHNNSSSPVPTLVPLDQPASVAEPTISAMTGAYAKQVPDDQPEYQLVGMSAEVPPPTTKRKRRHHRTGSAEHGDFPPPVRSSKRWLVASITIALVALLGSVGSLFYWQHKSNQLIAEALDLPAIDQPIVTKEAEATPNQENSDNVATLESKSQPLPESTNPEGRSNEVTQSQNTVASPEEKAASVKEDQSTDSTPPPSKPPNDWRLLYKSFPCPLFESNICVAPRSRFRITNAASESIPTDISWKLEFVPNKPGEQSGRTTESSSYTGQEFQLPATLPPGVFSLQITLSPISKGNITVENLRILEPIRVGIKLSSLSDKEQVSLPSLPILLTLENPPQPQELFVEISESQKSSLYGSNLAFGDIFPDYSDQDIESILLQIGEANKSTRIAKKTISERNVAFRKKMTDFLQSNQNFTMPAIDSKQRAANVNDLFTSLSRSFAAINYTSKRILDTETANIYFSITATPINVTDGWSRVDKLTKLWDDDLSNDIDEIENALSKIVNSSQSKKKNLEEFKSQLMELGPKQIKVFQKLSQPKQSKDNEIQQKPQYISFDYPIEIYFRN